MPLRSGTSPPASKSYSDIAWASEHHERNNNSFLTWEQIATATIRTNPWQRLDFATRGRQLMRKFFLLCNLLLLSLPLSYVHAEEEKLNWWNGISFTPGAGLRHLGLDVVRKSDGYQGNIAQDVGSKGFVSFSVESPEYHFGDSGFGLSLRSYSSFVTLDRQFYNYGYTLGSGSNDGGDRIDVGTSVSGSYSYIAPIIHYKLARGKSYFKAAFGYGLWNAKFNGTMILTPDDQPHNGMPADDIKLRTRNQLAYLFSLSWRSKSQWLIEMTGGGPEFSDRNYRYKVEEVAIIIGKTFTL